MTKSAHILILTILFSLTAPAQSPYWSWALASNVPTAAVLSGMATDASGNTYACGNFTCQYITFGNITLANQNSNLYYPDNDIFLVKLNDGGQVQWAKTISGNYISVSNICTDNQGHFFISGGFESLLTIGTDSFTSTANYTIFIARFDSTGTLQWLNSYSSEDFLTSGPVTCDVAGNVVFCGRFAEDSINFGSYTLRNNGCMNCGATDVFLAKYDNSGNITWAKSGGAQGVDYPNDICCDPYGCIFLTGSYFNGPVVYGSVSSSSNSLAFHAFLVKFNPSGDALWCETADGAQASEGAALAVDPSCHVYMLGNFRDTIHLGGLTLNYVGVNCWGDNACPHSFLIKLDASGTGIWSVMATGNSYDYASDMALSANEIYVTGRFFSASIHFGNAQAANNDPWFGEDVYVAKLGLTGNPLWVTDAGGSDNETSTCITAFGDHAIAGGVFSSYCMYFDTLQVCNSWTNQQNYFIARLNESANGINETASSEDYSVYPNPSSGNFNVRLPADGRERRICIYQENGQCIFDKQTRSDELVIDPGPVSGGLLLLRITDGKSSQTKKLVKD